MSKLTFAVVAFGALLFATGSTIADTHLSPPRETYSRIPGTEKPLLRMATQDWTCIENHCKAQIAQCQRTHSQADCNASSVCQQSARETGECDN